MNVVITGANGFVGKALTKRLLSVGEIKGKLLKKSYSLTSSLTKIL